MRLLKRNLSKRILNSNAIQFILCMVVALYIRLVHFTGRWHVIRGEIPAAYWDSDKPFILVLWHGRILLMPYAWRRNGRKVHGKDRDKGKDVHMLISAHRDGQLIAKTIGRLGIHSVEGSSSKGGAAALKRMVGVLKSGDYIGITPDGPRGPRMRASGGVVALARLSGVPIIPVTCSVTRFRMLKSWDRFIIAWPFCRGVFAWGEPIEVPRDADDGAQEEYRQKIEVALNDLCLEVDAMTGLPTPDPAPIEPVKAEAVAGEITGLRNSGEAS